MATERAKGWLAERLRPLCYSLHDLAVMTGEHYRQATRWNSGRYDPPPQVMEWVGKLERFFAANPPPQREEYVAARPAPAADQPPPFVQRIIDAMKPGETVSVDDLMARLGASRKSVGNRLSAAGVAGRLGPLRRVPAGVYRAVGGEMPPGGSLEFPPVVDKGVTTFVGQILDAMKPGEALDLAEVSARMGVRTQVIAKQLVKAAESDRLGPIELVGETVIRRVEDEDDVKQAPAPSPVVTAASPAPKPQPAPPAAAPMTTDRARKCLAELGWSQRSIGRLLQWPDLREPRRWFEGTAVMPPAVAAWLEGVVAAKHAAITSAVPGANLAPIVSAAVSAATGDPTKIRDAAMTARRAQPRPDRMLSPVDAARIKATPNKSPTVDGKALAVIERAAIRALRDVWMPRKALPFADAVLDGLIGRSLVESGALVDSDDSGQFYRLTEKGVAARREILAARSARAARLNVREHDLAARSPGWVPGVSMRACERTFYRVMASYTRSTPHLAENSAVATIVRQAIQNTHVDGMPIRAWVDASLRTLSRVPAEKLEAATAGKPTPAKPQPLYNPVRAPSDVIPGVGAERIHIARQALLRWIAADLAVAEIPPDDPAHKDVEVALRKAYVPGVSHGPWVEAAVVELEKMGYELADEDDPIGNEQGATRPDGGGGLTPSLATL